MKWYCPKIFNHICIDSVNKIRSCCGGETYKDENGNAISYTNDLAILDHPAIKAKRQKILDGNQIEECKPCYDIEEKTGHSIRKMYIEMEKEKYTTTTIEPRSLHFYFDNQCSLKCRMCNVTSSHLIGKEIEDHSTQFPKEFEYVTNNYNKYHKIDFEHLLIQLEPFLYMIKEVYVAGGEPTIKNTIYYRLVEKLIEMGLAKDIVLKITSNALNLNSKYVEMIKQFKYVSIDVSVDEVEERYNYLRYPGDWNKFVSNLEKLNSLPVEKYHLSFHIVLQIMNVYRLKYICSRLQQLNNKANITILPIRYKQGWGIEYLTFEERQKIQTDIPVHRVKEILQAELKIEIDEEERLKGLKNFLFEQKRYDSIRNQDLYTTIPELKWIEPYLNQYKL